MGVDWLTTIAQIVNFLVLVYLLKRFLYKPIVSAMTRREEHITGRLAEAEKKGSDAQQQIDAYLKKEQAFEHERETRLAHVKREVEATRAALMDEARSEVANTRTRWNEEIEREQKAFLSESRRVIGEQVCEVARNALRELANAELEQQMLQVLEHKLRVISADDRAALIAADTKETLVLQSHFPLAEENRQRINKVVHEQLASDIVVEFKQAPDMLCGLRLKRAGFKLEWNLENYLDRLDARLTEKLSLTPAQQSGN